MDSSELPHSDATERPCCVRETSVLCLQNVCALSAECICSTRASVNYLLRTHKAIDLYPHNTNTPTKQHSHSPVCLSPGHLFGTSTLYH